ncbi:Vomeronasal type-1 receptor 4 [Sciurus carolinensis]|uniref:Vomeronasal type-1 receptor n=1 Tax=Sciurus carolinensis TaxID=30640 RepID=A0AA41N9J0_SCICA|nr:Vomeronasal type-1 receptor 4 [Sciurus carolinensis]
MVLTETSNTSLILMFLGSTCNSEVENLPRVCQDLNSLPALKDKKTTLMMIPRDTIFGVFLISELCIGVLGNSLLFMLYAYIFLVKPHLKKHIDPIVTQLLFANTLTILFTMIPDITSSLGVRRFLDDVGCQTVLFSYRVTRGVSICTTSILSAFQAITVSPSNSNLAWLKFKFPACMYPLLLFFWVINMLIYIHVIETVTTIRNFTLVGCGYVHAYCQTRQFGNQNSGTFISAILIHDLVFVLLMICTSLYIVSLLYRHCRRVQHIHSPRISSQSSPEHKATHTILLLVCCFVFLYFSNNCLTLYSFYAHQKIPRLEGISRALSSCYPTICPFLLMKNNQIISQFKSFFSVMRMRGSQRTFDDLSDAPGFFLQQGRVANDLPWQKSSCCS